MKDENSRVSGEDIELAEEGFAEFVLRTGISKPSGKTGRKLSRTVLAAAFSALAAAAVVTAVFYYGVAFDDPVWIHESTSVAQTRTVILPDGTSVRLSPCSQITYPSEFSRRSRKVMLVGEAYLDVAKDSRRPFTLTANNMDVIVHGTQFNVSSYLSDEEDEVALVEGSVEMRLHGEKTSIYLKPNELVRYDKVNNITERRTFSANYYKEVLATDGLLFSNERLADIVATLNRRFGTNIIIENEALRTERYYAAFINGESAERILEALNIGNKFRITHKGNTYIIQ